MFKLDLLNERYFLLSRMPTEKMFFFNAFDIFFWLFLVFRLVTRLILEMENKLRFGRNRVTAKTQYKFYI